MQWGRFGNSVLPQDYRTPYEQEEALGAPEELEFLQGSKSTGVDLSLIYPTDPTQLPEELAGAEWPPKS